MPEAGRFRRLALRDGVEIPYLRTGREGSNRLVLIHSLGLDMLFWSRLADELDSEWDIVCYDCRGHGASSPDDGPFTAGQMAKDLAELLDELGWGGAVIAGASMGGMIALACAQNYPEIVRGLALIDTTAWYGPDAPEKWESRAKAAETDGLEALVSFQVDRWFTQSFVARNRNLVSDLVSVFLRNDPRSYAAVCRMLGSTDLRDGLASISTPTVVIVGESDYATPVAMAETLAASIPHASLHVLEDARHLTPVETPGPIAEILRRMALAVRWE